MSDLFKPWYYVHYHLFGEGAPAYPYVRDCLIQASDQSGIIEFVRSEFGSNGVTAGVLMSMVASDSQKCSQKFARFTI